MSAPRACRRRGAASVLAALALALLLAPAVDAQAAAQSDAPPRTLDLSGDGWRFWRDPTPDWPAETPVAPGTPLAELPVRAPTGGWEQLERGVAVTVPTSWEALLGPDDPDPRGVSWWSTRFELPPAVLAAPDAWSVSLRFRSVGRRAEVFVNRRFVGRDDVGNTAFDVPLELPDLLRTDNRLDVRVTDPGGNFGWRDEHAHDWGDAKIPAAHGFGGLLGGVELHVRPVFHVRDAWVETRLDSERAMAVIELDFGPAPDASPRVGVAPIVVEPPQLSLLADADTPRVTLQVSVVDPARPGERELFSKIHLIPLPDTRGRRLAELDFPIGDAPRWSPEDPRLLELHVSFGHDTHTQRFGLRRFELAGLGDDAHFELNGRRRLLRSAISWGYWPVTGGVPSEALARRQVESAKALGLDMLSHHRNAVHPRLLRWHDELGLLAYLEPGGYASKGGDELAHALARERWLRTIVLARRHPSVVIANMVNEASEPPGERARRDLADAQYLAPGLLLTYTSGWTETDAPEFGLHARPADPDGRGFSARTGSAARRSGPGRAPLHTDGWYDQHHAPGPGVWRDRFWKGPDEHLLRSDDRARVVFFGEDGAIGSPPRLASLVREWPSDALGWDGADYAARLAAWREDFRARGWKHDDAALDALLGSFADTAYDYHARVLENLRLDGVADGYVINGWDDQKLENHSGIVDALRRPKGDPELLARAAAPRLLALKPRASVLQVRPVHEGARLPAELRLDLGWVDETGVQGAHTLQLVVSDAARRELLTQEHALTLVGDGRPQWLLVDHALELPVEPGWLRVEARLLRGDAAAPDDDASPGSDASPGADDARLVAHSVEWILAVDGRHRALPGNGALLDDERGRLSGYFRDMRKVRLPRWSATGPARDWVLVADVDIEPTEGVPVAAFRQGVEPDAPAGLRRELFAGADFDTLVASSVDPDLDVVFAPESPPGGLDAPYTIRWSGALVPPESGVYRFGALTAGGLRLRLNGALVLERWPDERPDALHGPALRLTAGEPVLLELEFQQLHEASRVQLQWTRPSMSRTLGALADALIDRVRDEGTTLVVLSHADAWARRLQEHGALGEVERLKLERYWLGGGFFARPHPMLDGLPGNGALGRPWQALVHYGNPLFGLRAEGLRRVIGSTSDHQLERGTALGWLPHGRGRVVLCTLDVVSALELGPGAGDLPRHLLQNLVEWAAAGR